MGSFVPEGCLGLVFAKFAWPKFCEAPRHPGCEMTFHWVAAFIFLQQEQSHFQFQLRESQRAAGAGEEAALPLCLGKAHSTPAQRKVSW